MCETGGSAVASSVRFLLPGSFVRRVPSTGRVEPVQRGAPAGDLAWEVKTLPVQMTRSR